MEIAHLLVDPVIGALYNVGPCSEVAGRLAMSPPSRYGGTCCPPCVFLLLTNKRLRLDITGKCRIEICIITTNRAYELVHLPLSYTLINHFVVPQCTYKVLKFQHILLSTDSKIVPKNIETRRPGQERILC